MQYPEEPQEPEKREPPKKPSRKLPLICIAVTFSIGLTVLCCKPEILGSLKETCMGWFQLDKTAFASQIKAVTTAGADIRSGAGPYFKSVSVLPKGSKVFLVENSDSDWVKIKTSDGKTGWCERGMLQILPSSSSSSSASAPSAPASSQAAPSAQEISMDQAVKPISVQVSLSKQKVVVTDAKGRTIKNFICSSGDEGSETPTGTFTISGRGTSFYNKQLKEGAYYWTRFYGDYLFHSPPFDENRNMEPEEIQKLGTPASHGCIRLSMGNAKWVYDNIPDGTKVVIAD